MLSSLNRLVNMCGWMNGWAQASMEITRSYCWIATNLSDLKWTSLNLLWNKWSPTTPSLTSHFTAVWYIILRDVHLLVFYSSSYFFNEMGKTQISSIATLTRVTLRGSCRTIDIWWKQFRLDSAVSVGRHSNISIQKTTSTAEYTFVFCFWLLFKIIHQPILLWFIKKDETTTWTTMTSSIGAGAVYTSISSWLVMLLMSPSYCLAAASMVAYLSLVAQSWSSASNTTVSVRVNS